MRAKRSFLRDNGLTLLFLLFFFPTLFLGQMITGARVYNQDLMEHGQAAIGMWEYFRSGHFLEATMENWESEFLQMFAFVLATAYLFQRGSAESHDPDEKSDPHKPIKRNSPWPVRRGGWVLRLYEHSLSLAFFVCFLVFLWLHAYGGAIDYNEEILDHGGGQLVTTWTFMKTSQFWFESFQNWQSEFLSVAAMVAFSIWLREKGSSQSKPVEAPHSETGTG
jgi:hypothetical protein